MIAYIEVITPLNVNISVSEEYWDYIVRIKHTVMNGKENVVIATLSAPDEIRKSSTDKNVYLYYRNSDKLYCVVTRHLNGSGFIITCYPTNKIKEGELIWKK